MISPTRHKKALWSDCFFSHVDKQENMVFHSYRSLIFLSLEGPAKLRSRIGGANEMWIDPWLPNGQEKSFSFKMVSGWKVVFNLGPWPTFGFNSINKSLIKSEKKKPILGLQRLIKSRQQPLHKVFLLAWKWGQGYKLQSKT